MGLVLDPNGQPEPYVWAVLQRGGGVIHEQQVGDLPELTFSRDVDPDRVGWIALVPQYPGRPVVRCRIPPGARARFWRRRIHEGAIGMSDSQVYLGSLHEVGWRDADGLGPSLFVGPDGSVVFGVDDGTLCEDMGV